MLCALAELEKATSWPGEDGPAGPFSGATLSCQRIALIRGADDVDPQRSQYQRTERLNYFQQIKDKIERNQAPGRDHRPWLRRTAAGPCPLQGGLAGPGVVDQSKIESLARGRNYLVHLGDGMTRELLESGQFRKRHRRLHPPGRVRRGHCVRAHAPGTPQRTGPFLCPQGRGRDRQVPAPGPADFARVHHLPPHHPRRVPPRDPEQRSCRVQGPQERPGLSYIFSPGKGPGKSHSTSFNPQARGRQGGRRPRSLASSCTRRASPTSWRCPQPKSPSQPSCSRISSGPSTSPWSMR